MSFHSRYHPGERAYEVTIQETYTQNVHKTVYAKNADEARQKLFNDGSVYPFGWIVDEQQHSHSTVPRIRLKRVEE